MVQIAHIESPYTSKFGVPRQAGLVEGEARVVFEPPFRVAEAVRGLEGFDYVWLIWQFHLNRREKTQCPNAEDSAPEGAEWSPTVRPPRLGGNKRVGVFASRSPFRPNPIGLSSVRLLGVEIVEGLGPVLRVQGADLVDGTPIFDIKPYLAYADSHPDARSGFAPQAPAQCLQVDDPRGLLAALPPHRAAELRQALALDPRPHFHHDPQRRYVMPFDRWEVAFRVIDERVEVLEVVVK